MATAKGKSPEPESGKSLANLLSGLHTSDNMNVLHINRIDFSTINTKVTFSEYKAYDDTNLVSLVPYDCCRMPLSNRLKVSMTS